LADFKQGQIRVLVATDIAARGLDIAQLPLVVNYELPHVPEDYVHRIGRTGRAGRDGVALSLVCEDEATAPARHPAPAGPHPALGGRGRFRAKPQHPPNHTQAGRDGSTRPAP
jgi:hypothetical protein